VERLRGIDISKASDASLIEEERFYLSSTAHQHAVEVFIAEFLFERFRRQFAKRFCIAEIRGPDDHHHPEVALIGEEEFLAFIEPEDRVCMSGIGGIGLDYHESPGHPQVSDQSAPVIEPEEDVLPSPSNVINAGATE
jgi:hypothetical protein